MKVRQKQIQIQIQTQIQGKWQEWGKEQEQQGDAWTEVSDNVCPQFVAFEFCLFLLLFVERRVLRDASDDPEVVIGLHRVGCVLLEVLLDV